MKRRYFLYLASLVILAASACTDEHAPPEDVVVTRVNDFTLTRDEFQTQLARELELDEAFKLTRETKEQFLEQLIRKELLIQEARRQKLDQQQEFIRTIERYWESTLIRNLIDLKSREIHQKVLVSQEEIQARYQAMKENGQGLPDLSQLESKIEAQLKEEKKSRILKEWIDKMRDQADIQTYPSRL